VTSYRVADIDEIKVGCLKRVEANGVPICLAHLSEGGVFAVSDICSHEETELSGGDLQGNEIECPAHGSRFNVETGEVSGLPASEPVRVFEVTVKGQDVFVDL
jgi:3-phenylpropionate/trans-cinnamate dioxygenase ferredoxin subunit